MTVNYECNNGWLLEEFFVSDIQCYESFGKIFINEVELVVKKEKDSYEQSGNRCYVIVEQENTTIYDIYAEPLDEYENTKCQLPTDELLFLTKEWLEKKQDFVKKYPDNIFQIIKTKIFGFFGKKI